MSGTPPKTPWGQTEPGDAAHPLPDPDRAPLKAVDADPAPDGPMGAPPANLPGDTRAAAAAPDGAAPMPEAMSVAVAAVPNPAANAPEREPVPPPGPWARPPAQKRDDADAEALAVGGVILGRMGVPGVPMPGTTPGTTPATTAGSRPATPDADLSAPNADRPNRLDLGMPMGLSRTDFFAAIRANRRNTFVLCGLLLLIGVILGAAVGWAFGTLAEEPGGPRFAPDWAIYGAVFMMVFSLIWTVIALTVGDKIMLGMTGAREVSPDEEQMLHNVVEEMALAAGLPKPRVFIIETDALNAFATGLKPEKAVIGVTRGLLRSLTRDELQGVVGHEMSHIGNNDIMYMTAVGVLVGLIALVSELAIRSIRFMPRGRGKSGGAVIVAIVILLLVGLLSPIAAALVQMAVSRQREYLADATSVKLTRNPWGLIGALRKLDSGQNKWDGASKATQHLFIANPFKHFGEKSSALMSTHPAIELRIKRLTDLG